MNNANACDSDLLSPDPTWEDWLSLSNASARCISEMRTATAIDQNASVGMLGEFQDYNELERGADDAFEQMQQVAFDDAESV